MSIEFVRVKEEIEWESGQSEDDMCIKQEKDSEAMAREILHVKIERKRDRSDSSCLRVPETEFDETDHWHVKKEVLAVSEECTRVKEEPDNCVREKSAKVKTEKDVESETYLAVHEVKKELVLGPEELQPQDIAFLQFHNTVPDKFADKNQEAQHMRGCHSLLKEQDSKEFEFPSNTAQSLTEEHLSTFHEKTKSNNYLSIKKSKIVNLGLYEGHNAARQYICDTCGKHFPRKINMIVHIRSHVTQAQCVCDICHKRYTNKFNLRRHKRIHMGDKPYSCDACNRRFTDPCNLVSHKRLHSEEKPFTCNVCNKQFRQNAHLRGHMRVHTGEKPFPCKICNKQFSSVYNLNRHRRTHTGEKPFSCEFCDKQFGDIRNLIRHKLIHTDTPGPYECDVCLKPFRDSSNLCRHKQIHSEATFNCEVCRKRFFNLYNLNRHKREACKATKKEKKSNFRKPDCL